MAPRMKRKATFGVQQHQLPPAAAKQAFALPPATTAKEEEEITRALEESTMLARAEELQAEELRRIMELSMQDEEERRQHEESLNQAMQLSVQEAVAAEPSVASSEVTEQKVPSSENRQTVQLADGDEFVLEGEVCEETLDEWVVVDAIEEF
mmetsp:Transcript_17013/g.30738  ORF Transcript_17013/g.30738 Transcript_17013/m.30738 type:complete len:152 (+) Transcript_17013:91-546(+)